MIAALAWALLAAGCTAETPAGSEPTSPADTVDCAHDIGGRPPDAGDRLILDAVALPTSRLQAAESGEPGRLFAKAGLLVRAGTEVKLTVDTPDVTIGWGSPGPEGTTITVPACPDTSGWLAFAGGYHVPEPICVELTIHANAREEHARVNVGAAC